MHPGRLNSDDVSLLPTSNENIKNTEKVSKESKDKPKKSTRGRRLLELSGSDDDDDEGNPNDEQGDENTDVSSNREKKSGRSDGVAEEEEAAEQGVSEAAAALEAVIHSAAQVAQTEQAEKSPPPPISAEVAFEAQKADLVRQRACVAYLCEMQRFAVYVATGIEDMRIILHSKTVTDVLEAIEFFLTAKQGGVRNLDAALRHMMAMIWSQEEQIRKAVLDAFRCVCPPHFEILLFLSSL